MGDYEKHLSERNSIEENFVKQSFRKWKDISKAVNMRGKGIFKAMFGFSYGVDSYTYNATRKGLK